MVKGLQKFKYPYPWDSKIIQMPYPRAKAIDQIPALCPASPRRLIIDKSTLKLKFNTIPMSANIAFNIIFPTTDDTQVVVQEPDR